MNRRQKHIIDLISSAKYTIIDDSKRKDFVRLVDLDGDTIKYIKRSSWERILNTKPKFKKERRTKTIEVKIEFTQYSA